jgi:hypothetical protein
VPIANETILSFVFAGLGVYFSVMVLRALDRYLAFRRVSPTALVSWSAPSPRGVRWLLAMGLVAAAVTIVNAFLGRPFHHVYGQGVMAVYFIVMVPLLSRIRLGLYRDGVWADVGFLPWDEIQRMAFRETPDIVLVLLPRRGWQPFRLPVPPSEYGVVRKLLEDKIRAHALNLERGILGL